MPGDGGEAISQRCVLALECGCGSGGGSGLVVDGDIDVGDLKVHGGNEVDAGDLRDGLDQLGRVPSVVGKWGKPAQVPALATSLPRSEVGRERERERDWDLRRAHAADHVLVKRRAELAIAQTLLAKHLRANLPHGLLAEEGERVGDGVGRDAVALEADVLHGDDVGGGREGDVLLGVEGLALGGPGVVDEVLREGVGRAGGRLGRGADDGGRRGLDEARHCVCVKMCFLVMRE